MWCVHVLADGTSNQTAERYSFSFEQSDGGDDTRTRLVDRNALVRKVSGHCLVKVM